MNEIKFRAWNKEEKEIIKALTLLNLCDRVSASLALLGGEKKNNDLFDHLIFMQYTGLKDKNGKEIYEGDIVEYKFREDLDEIQEEVKWEKDDTGFTPFNDYCYEDKVLFGKDCEIIGNIHENPNLLK